MKLNLTGLLFGAIAATFIPFATLAQAEEALDGYDCPDEFVGIELPQAQVNQLERLEGQLEQRYEQILPMSPAEEAQLERLEEDFEDELYALLSTQQKQDLEKLDVWADEQLMAIAPEIFDEEGEEELDLTPQQEARLDDVDEAYEQRFQALLTAEQQAAMEALELQLEEEMDAVFPELSPAQEEQLDALEQTFEQQAMNILTVEQRQQFEQNLACELPD